jgi:hypothetical protein
LDVSVTARGTIMLQCSRASVAELPQANHHIAVKSCGLAGIGLKIA